MHVFDYLQNFLELTEVHRSTFDLCSSKNLQAQLLKFVVDSKRPPSA
jgi:hypothetical protein